MHGMGVDVNRGRWRLYNIITLELVWMDTTYDYYE